jgi:hypothetical protein
MPEWCTVRHLTAGSSACAGRIFSSDRILTRQDVAAFLTGQTRSRESARASSRVSRHHSWTGNWTPTTATQSALAGGIPTGPRASSSHSHPWRPCGARFPCPRDDGRHRRDGTQGWGCRVPTGDGCLCGIKLAILAHLPAGWTGNQANMARLSHASPAPRPPIRSSTLSMRQSSILWTQTPTPRWCSTLWPSSKLLSNRSGIRLNWAAGRRMEHRLYINPAYGVPIRLSDLGRKTILFACPIRIRRAKARRWCIC